MAQSTPHTKKRTIDETITPDHDTEHFDRFFVVKSKEASKPLSKLSPFVVEKCISSSLGTVNSVRRLRSGDLLIELNRSSQVPNILKWQTLFDVPVSVSAHRSMNSCKGVIRCLDLIHVPENEILQNLDYAGVTYVKKIQSYRTGRALDTPVVILTFQGNTLPQ